MADALQWVAGGGRMFHLRRSVVIAAVVGVALACGNIREDELECEEAVSRLTDCCPAFDSTPISCAFSVDSSCDPDTTYPALSISESQCIRSESCAMLVASGVCTRAQAARSVTISSEPGTSGNPPLPSGACP